ncbi:unnamed protein product [Acanthoscelides obtectus]|uniref:Sulfatase N-terminal domain-containing protein n=1 Tax=Acanthoscelides obtectus TaxID=200917 RepID=A0A9P0PMY8_ACAOB|nr:unnamed protein product [Acanthoscelides obtectus]CAK1649115.1 N-acetylglucosamine-6-sulfatase [Acanthoscelides obtectus]
MSVGRDPKIVLLCNILAFVAVGSKPNFVFFLTDDQDVLLNGMVPLTRTHFLLGLRGKTFTNAYVNTPICCPSRSTILTGKYAHNTGVVNNSIAGNCSSRYWQRHQEKHSLAANLKENEYVTFYAGKYLNAYGHKDAGGTKHVPKGYDWWIGLKGNSRYYNYTLSLNGSAKFFKDDYLTDVLTKYGKDFLKMRPRGNPFFMMLAPPACHAPFTPAKRHEHTFNGTKVVRNPAFNYTSSGKHWLVRMQPQQLPQNVSILDDIQRHRLQSLLAVDEMVKTIVEEVESAGEINNTYFIFTSDHGFHIGQFSLPWDKRQPYETDIRVPFLISGPSIPHNTTDDYPISAVDLVPTILDLAGTEIPNHADGVSFKQRLLEIGDEAQSYEKLILVEYWGEGNKKSIDDRCPWKEDGNLAAAVKATLVSIMAARRSFASM